MDIFFDDICKPKRSRSLPRPVTFATTPGRGQRDPFKNFLACFKQQNSWVEEGRMHEMAVEMWEKFDKTQRREFYPDKYKIRMKHKLAMVTLVRKPETIQSEGQTDNVAIKTLLGARPLKFSVSKVFDDKAVGLEKPLNKLEEASVIDLTGEELPNGDSKEGIPFSTDSKDGSEINSNNKHIRCLIDFILKKKSTKPTEEMHDSTTETTYDINDNISRDTNNMSSNNNDDSMDCSNDLPDTEVSFHPSHKNDEDKVESSDVSPVANYSLPDRSTVDLANLSNTSISPNEPFINFLHDFSIQRNTKPIESYDDAVLAWSLMEQEEKAAYEPENYVLKLFMRDENFSKQFSGESMEVDDQDESSASDDDEITVILPPPSERKSNKAGTTRRALKKPRKRLNAGAKQSSSENKLGKRSSSLQNFLAFMHQKLKKYDSFDKTLLGTTLWRHMTSLEKNQFDNNDYLYKLKKEVKDEGVQTMPCLPCSKSTQVSTEDFSIVSPSTSKSPYTDQSQCSINSRPSSELSDQSSLHSSKKTLKFETSTVSDNSVLESEAFASDNSSQTMDSENDSNNQSGKEWSFLKYFRWR